jgi:multidrug efflux pump subunit AcrA (membrane-fusion protein)
LPPANDSRILDLVWVAAIGLVQGLLGQQKAAEQAAAEAQLEARRQQTQVYLMAAGVVGLGLLAVILKGRR